MSNFGSSEMFGETHKKRTSDIEVVFFFLQTPISLSQTRELFHSYKIVLAILLSHKRFKLLDIATGKSLVTRASHKQQMVFYNYFLVLRLVHKSDFKFGTCYTQESTTCMYLTEWEGGKENISLEVRRYGPSAVALTQSMTILSYDQFLVNFHVCEGC